MLFPGWRGGQGGDRGSKPAECISATAHAWHAPSAEPQVKGRLISASAVRGGEEGARAGNRTAPRSF